ncbi:retrovirus-related pol polyprotein from transposon TNT 1-94 [Tanacetum coccineum]
MATNEETNAAGTDTRPPMLVESDYDSWKIRIHRYIRGKPNGKLIWKSIQNGPTPHPMVTDPSPSDSTIMPAPRKKLDSEFNEEENKLEMADTQAEIILSQGLPRHIFNILNQTSTAKEIWDNVELLMQGSGRTLQQRKEDLFDEYERFRAIGNESIHDYFVRFHKLVNDMKITQLEIPTHQMNTKFVNNLPAYWGKYVTNVKQNMDISTTPYVQIYTHLKAYEPHAKKTLKKQEQSTSIVDPLAYVAHTTSAPALSSPSTPSPQPTAQSPNDALMATMTQIANLLSGFQKQFPPTNNQLRTSSNSRTHATVHDGHIVTEPVQRKAPGNVGNTGARGKKVICYNCRGEGHVARQCKEPKRKMDSQYFKDKALLMEAKEKGDVLDAEAEAFLADVECTAPYDQPQALTTTNMFQANHEDAYDSDVDEGPNAAVAFMANLSSTSATNNPVNEVHSNDNQIFDNVDYQLSQEMHQEEHLDSDAETEIDDNTIPYHQYLLDTEAQNVPTEVSADTSDKVSMIAILTDLQTQLDGHAKIPTRSNLILKTKLDRNKLVIQRNKRNAELVQENDLLKSTLSGKEKSIAFLQSEKEKILSEKKELADSYLDEIVCLKTANKSSRDTLARISMPTQTIPMLSKKPIKATDDLHKDILGTRNPGLGYMAKRAQPVLYDADTLLHPTHHPVSIWDSEEVLVHQVVSMKKMNEKPGHVRPENGFYEKLNALMFVPQKELSGDQVYWLSANEIASQASKPATPATPFVHKSPPPSQVLANLQKVNAVFHQFEGIIKERTTQKPDYVSEWCYDYAKQFVEQQLVPFYDHFKKHIQAANDTLFKEVKEYEQIFDDLDAEYERCVLDNKNLTIEKKNLLIKNDCLIAECLEKDICSIGALTIRYCCAPSQCAPLRRSLDRMAIGNTLSASNAIFEINKLRKQLQGKDDTIRNLDAQINIMKVLNVGSTEGSCDQQALDTDRIQLQDTITSLRIQLDGLKVENVSLKRRYDELSKANTHSRTVYTEKLSALTTELTKLQAQVTGKTSSGPSTSETPKVLAPGMYNIGSKYIPPPKRANWVKPTPLPKKKQVTFQEPPRTSNRHTQKLPVQQNTKPNVPVNLSTRTKPATASRKPMPKSHTQNHRILPSKSVNARRAADHNRKLNVVDHNQFVIRSLKYVNTKTPQAKHSVNHTKKVWKATRNHNVNTTKTAWRPTGKVVGSVKPQWKPTGRHFAFKPQWRPTGRHFSLFEKYPLTRIMEPTDMPIELPSSASSSPKITMVSRFTDHKLSDRQAGSKGISENHQLCVEKFIWTVRFGNDEYAAIVGYGDYKLGDTIISRVYYVEGLKHNLFSVGQFCDGGLEVAFRQHSCHIRNYDMVDLLNGSRTTNLYSISLNDMMSASPVCLLTKASSTKSWLWHRRLNHLNFRTLNELARNNLVRGLPMLKYDKDHLRPSCQLGKSKKASHPLKAENTNTEVLHTLHMDLCGPMRTKVITERICLVIVDDYTDLGWLGLRVFGISHETSVPRSPQQNGIVERRNRTLMEAARTMLIFAKAPLFLWAEAVATACYKADIDKLCCYAPTKKAYRIYNKRTAKIQETVHVTFDELTEGLTSVQTSSGLAPQQMTYVPNSNKHELLLLQFMEGSRSCTVIPPPAVPIPPVNAHAAQAPENAIGSPSTTVISEGAPAVTESLLPHQIPLPDTSDSDIETLFDNVDSNVFDTYTAPETDSEASSSNTVNIDVTPNNQLPHVQKWTQAHSLENIIGDKDRPVSTRKQLETDAMWCFFNEFLTHVEPKTYKQALEHSC